MKSILGELSLHFEGYGFVTPIKPGLSDVFVPARLMGDAMHGDTVEVTCRKGRREGLLEGEIIRIHERRLKQLVGKLTLAGKKWAVVSEDQRVRHCLYLTIPPKNAHPGDYVVAKILKYPSGKKPLTGEVIETLPERGSLPAEVEYVIARHQLPKTFSTAAKEEAQSIQQKGLAVGPEGRQDLRGLPFVTIDGEDAKDFDDAVFAKKLKNDSIRLWVAIADVSHYVRPGSAIDKEAYTRGTSVYFPGKVIPMLPEVLSNDLCSLRPHEDRLAMVAEMEIDRDGRVSREEIYAAVFHSHARLTYKWVKRMLLDREEALCRENENILLPLKTLSEAATRLHRIREKRGSLDFDLPEPEIVLDLTGGIEHIEKSSRDWSHQIIEELMIAANESVARFLTEHKGGSVFRVHGSPDKQKIRDFYAVIQRLGFRGHFQYPVTTKTLGQVLKFFKEHPEERFVNTLLLRSLDQAVYSEQNLGHFGLGSRCYCHFTSPIRRYPDLIVHRLLKTVLLGKGARPARQKELERMAEHCSRQERRALDAEREMIRLHRVLFLRQKIGEHFEGIISHVARFGFFVELIDYFVEGLVEKEGLQGDRFRFDPENLALRGKKNRRVFKIGDRVRVAVEEVKLSERRAFFKLLDQPRSHQ